MGGDRSALCQPVCELSFESIINHSTIALCFDRGFLLMRRDSIFYALFQRSPSLLFELLENPPDGSDQYRFESVAVKEPKFEIDGVFLPPTSETPGTVFFAEVQMQKDEQLYERLFGESFLYFYRNRERYSDWQAVVIYSSRSVEQSNSHPYRSLMNSEQVHRVYLDELGEMETLPFGIAAMVLTIVGEAEAAERARMLIDRANREAMSVVDRQGIIRIVSTIMVYKFSKLSRQEIDAMLGLKLEETRVYREAKEDGKQEEKQEIAINLLQQGFPIEAIAKATKLTIEQIQQLQTQLSQE
jgi:predicted transposase/invertase (TIGR01784 family)